MTTENPVPDGNSAQERVQSLENQLAELNSALLTVKRTRRIVLVLFFAFVGLIVFLLNDIATELRSEEYLGQLRTEAEKSLENNSAEYMKEVQSLTDEVTPVVTKAFYEQAKKDAPLYAGSFDREKEQLAENLRVRIEEEVNNYYDNALNKYEAELIRNFPKAQDENVRRQLKANLRRSLNKLATKYYADQLKAELDQLYAAWETFPPADMPDKEDLPLEDQLIGYLFELMTVKLSGHGTNILDVGKETAGSGSPPVTAPPGTDEIPETSEETEPKVDGEGTETKKPSGSDSDPKPDADADDQTTTSETKPKD